jgi:hypothetical protein
MTIANAACLYGHVVTRYGLIADDDRRAVLRMQLAVAHMRRELAGRDQGGSLQVAPDAGGGGLFGPADCAYEPSALCVMTTEPVFEGVRALLASFDASLPPGALFTRAHAACVFAALTSRLPGRVGAPGGGWGDDEACGHAHVGGPPRGLEEVVEAAGGGLPAANGMQFLRVPWRPAGARRAAAAARTTWSSLRPRRRCRGSCPSGRGPAPPARSAPGA